MDIIVLIMDILRQIPVFVAILLLELGIKCDLGLFVRKLIVICD